MNADDNKQLSCLIDKMTTKSDLEYASALLKFRWKIVQVLETKNAVAQGIRIGAKVTFFARGKTFQGTVLKINNKSVKVSTDTGTWTVSPTLLKLDNPAPQA